MKRSGFLFVIMIGLLALLLAPLPAARAMPPGLSKAANAPTTISPYWPKLIQQWGSEIAVLSNTYGLDADLIAAVVDEESNGNAYSISRVGAVGLMGVMPSGPGLEWRPPADELANPAVNLRWGVGILSEVIRQSGGDLFAALGAYNGGWANADRQVPRQYAAKVLDEYGRAIVARNGLSPDMATQWTIAIKLRRGNMAPDSLMVLGDQPVSGLHTFGHHVLYQYVDAEGTAYYVEGYAVPVALVISLDAADASLGDADLVEPELLVRLGEISGKKITRNSNPHVLLACLPSLSRLRGRASTRWFAPSDCPSWHR